MDMYFERSLAVLLVALSWTIVGCGEAGGERAEVRGKVTFEGVPVESGSIAFAPIEGTKGPSVGGAIKGGEYHIRRGEGPVSGPHRVMILGTRQPDAKCERVRAERISMPWWMKWRCSSRESTMLKAR
jgi:hypothetical protein